MSQTTKTVSEGGDSLENGTHHQDTIELPESIAQIGCVYILEFGRPLRNPDSPYGQARYYIGYADGHRLDERLREHRTGQGAAITRAAVESGIDLRLRCVFGGDREVERRLKKRKDTPGIVAQVLRGHAPYDLPVTVFN